MNNQKLQIVTISYKANWSTLQVNKSKRSTVKFPTQLQLVRNPPAKQNVVHIRICAFCNFRADYANFPDGSFVAAGICACLNCLRSEKTVEFREAFGIKSTQLKEGRPYE